VLPVPEFDPPRRFVGPEDGLVPDPSFWGPDRGSGRRRRAGLGERITAAVPGREARTAIAAVVAVLVVTGGLVSYRASLDPASPGAVTPPPRAVTARRARSSAPTSRRVVVHVAGAVTHPGVVTLPGGARVIDALDAAGGALATANLDAVNLAARLRDGQQILVPPAAGSGTTTSSTSSPTVPALTPATGG
jgi:competence protein ComEA